MDTDLPALPYGAVSSFARIADLEVRIEEAGCRALDLAAAAGACPRSVEVVLHGGGESGSGEAPAPDRNGGAAAAFARATEAVVGRWRIHEFSSRLSRLGLGGRQRWAFESGALVLALRQAGTSLAEILDRPLRPIRYLLADGLGCPPDLALLASWRRRDRALGFALVADESWGDEVLSALATLGRIEVVDFRSFQREPLPAPELLRRVSAALPHAIFEDAALTEETRALLLERPGALSWDAAIYSTIEIEALAPQAICVKPGRFGCWRRLLDAYDLCLVRGILCYAGGDGESGPGRRQLQYLASLFHADAPNDAAPVELRGADPAALAEPPVNPLPPAAFDSAFGRPG